MAINIELLEKVKAHILAEPRRVRMEAWCVSTHMRQEDRDKARFGVLEELYVKEYNADEEEAASLGFGELLDFPACGTVACIAGWGALLSEPDPEAALKDPDLLSKLYTLSRYKAQALFGVDDDEGERLFHVHNWPDEFKEDYETASSPADRARVVVERIDHFIETNGEE